MTEQVPITTEQTSASIGQTHVPTNCHFCGYLCAFTATVEDGKLVDLAPDPTRYPYDETIVRGCRRWRLNIDFIDSPSRINYPMKRVGERGSGQWEQVSWDEALDEITTHMQSLIETHGPETVASAIGGPHASFWPLHRFMNLLGSPNNMGIGQICWNPRIWMDTLTFGWTIEADLQFGVTEAMIIWGTNPAQSDNSAFWRSVVAVGKSDIPLVVIDPRKTQTARVADVWLPIRPGTDCTLALAFLQVIIEEGLIDRPFIDRWCYGFDELVAHVAPYTPEYAAAICGLDAENIRTAARLFGKAGAAVLISGRGIDQIGADVSPTHRAICCLRAITGNIDKPGACILTEMSDFTHEVDLEMSDAMDECRQQRCLNTPYTPLQCYTGYRAIEANTMKLGRRLPKRYMTSAHPDLVLRAMEVADPYPIRALIINATNPLLTYADTHRVLRALFGLDLIVVLEYTMTSTACIADYVLPVAGAIERPVMQVHGGVANIAYGGPAAVEPYYGRKTDYDIFRELGIRFGQGDLWPEETLAEAFGASLEKAGITWSQFCTTGLYWRPPMPAKHEALGIDGLPVGFATETGKIELASKALEHMGGQRLPSPSDRAYPREKDDRLILMTGARKQPYNASVFLDVEAFRTLYPKPLAEIGRATAVRLGLADGDEVVLENEKGAATFTLKVIDMAEGAISADYGWWYPEQKMCAPDFGGIWESNINVLTDCSVANGEEMIGTWSYNAITCSVRKKRVEAQ